MQKKKRPPIHQIQIENSYGLDDLDFTQAEPLSELVFETSDKPWQVNIVLVSDDFLADMHEKYLDDATPTDVITFDLCEPFEEFNEGEIYISVDRAKEQAQTFNVTFKSELYRLMVHGMLHLTGLNDISKDEKKQMRLKEDEFLQKFNLL